LPLPNWLAQVGSRPTFILASIFMFPYRESICYHLTPRGWFAGDKQLRYGILQRRPAPDDQVLSVISRITIAANGLMLQTPSEIWRSTDHARVVGLLARFGPAPVERWY
jgi:hypothetical protein